MMILDELLFFGCFVVVLVPVLVRCSLFLFYVFVLCLMTPVTSRNLCFSAGYDK